MYTLHQSWIPFTYLEKIRNFQIILNKNKKTVRYGSETISYRTPLLWVNLPEEYKLANSQSDSESKIKVGNVIYVSDCYLELSFRIQVLSKIYPVKLTQKKWANFLRFVLRDFRIFGLGVSCDWSGSVDFQAFNKRSTYSFWLQGISSLGREIFERRTKKKIAFSFFFFSFAVTNNKK